MVVLQARGRASTRLSGVLVGLALMMVTTDPTDTAGAAVGAEEAVLRFVTSGGHDSEGFRALCLAEPDTARRVLSEYLAEHDDFEPDLDPWTMGAMLGRDLGTDAVDEFVARGFAILTTRDLGKAWEWLRILPSVTLRPLSWSAYYRMRQHASHPWLVHELDRMAIACKPTPAEVGACPAGTSLQYALRARGWQRAAFEVRSDEGVVRTCNERALDDATKAYELDGSSILAIQALASAELSFGKLEKSLEHANEAIERDGSDWAGYRIRAVTYRRLGRTADADADMARAETLRAESEEAARVAWVQSPDGLRNERTVLSEEIRAVLVRRARGEPSDQQEGQALVDLARIIECHPEEHSALLARGLLRQERGQWTDALADYDALAAAMPGGAYVQLLRSEALRALGRREEADAALAAYRAALGLFVLPVLPDAADLQSPMPPPQDGREVLASQGEPVVELARTLLAETDRPQEFLAAARALQDLDGARLAPAVGLLERATLVPGLDGPQKVALFGLLARAKSPSSVLYLVKAILDDPAGDPLPRTVALRALTGFPAEDRIPVLLAVLRSTDDEDLRRGIRSALQDRGGAEDTAMVWTDMLLRGPREVQVEAAQRVAGYGLGLLVLVEIARDDGTDPAVRRQAIDAITRQHAEIAESLGK